LHNLKVAQVGEAGHVSGEQTQSLLFSMINSIFSSNLIHLKLAADHFFFPSSRSLFSDLYFDCTVANPFNPSKASHASPHASPSPKAPLNQATVILCTTATLSGLSSVVSTAS